VAGIEVNNATETGLYITNSTIQDAEIAVESIYGGLFEIHNSIFDFNEKHIVLGPASGVHPGVLATSDLLFTGPLLPPFTGDPCLAGVEANYVVEFSIGTHGGNYFEGMKTGILAVASDVTANNNTFEDVEFGIYALGGGAVNALDNTLNHINNDGITAIDANGSIPPYKATHISGNTFNDCMGHGIQLAGNYEVQLFGNDMQNIGKTGIRIWTSAGPPIFHKMEIEDNTIDQALNGIGINNFPSSNVKIKNNHISSIDHTAILHNSGTNGIPFFRSKPDIISQNTISDVFQGIVVTNQP